ncbi:MAG: S8 family serine peptidase, partial [Candidatus Eremiobacterota bacterium]
LGLAATVWWEGPGRDQIRLKAVGVAPAQTDARFTFRDADGPGPLPPNLERVEGVLVVDLVDDAGTQQILELEKRLGVDLRYNTEHSAGVGIAVAQVGEDRMPHLLNELARDPLVQHVEPDYVYYASDAPAADFPNDPMYNYNWHMRQVRCEQAWPWTSGQNAVVAVLDTGVAYANYKEFHQVEDLDRTKFVPGYDFVNKHDKPLDDHAHGTHVAGTIAQSTNNGKGVVGLAWGCAIMPVKVLSGRGSGTVSAISDAIVWSSDHGANVINMSLGGGFPSTVMDEACSYAKRHGTTVVCAAGNESRPRPSYPAGYDACVSVSALDFEENLSWYSNHGPEIDISAPGGDTRSDKNGDGKPDGVLQNTIGIQNPRTSDYYWFQGTSMASPHAAGGAALVVSLGVTRPDAVEALLKSTARSKGKEGKERGFGAGVLDAGRAAWKAGFLYGAYRFGLALVIGLFVLLPLLRRGAIVQAGAALPGLVIGSSGLFFLPLILGNSAPLNPLVTSGFPQWDMVLLGAAGHANPIFYSCLIPMALAVLVVENRFLRAVVAGFTAGIAAHLLIGALTGAATVLYIPAILSRLWLLGNGLVCVFLAVVLAEDQP